MSITYGGDGSQPTSRAGGAKIAIAAVGNTTPITITTGSTHSYVTGDTIQIDGTSIAAANITASIVVTSTNQFTLNGTVAAGVGSAGGYVQNYEITPLMTLPSDGDLRAASSVNVPLEAAADKQPWLYLRAGNYRCFGLYNIQTSDDTFAAWLTFTQPSSVIWYNAYTFTSWASNSPQPVVRVGDVLEIEFQTTIKLATGTAAMPMALGLILKGVGSGNGPLFAKIPGSGVLFPTTTVGRCHMRGHYVVGPVGAGPSVDDERTIDVCLLVQGVVASPNNVNLIGDRQMIIRHWRPNT